MKTPAPLIGVLAIVVICVQNSGLMLALGWGAIHGAVGGLFAWVPMAIAFALLRAGYLYLKRTSVRHMSLMFAAYALTIVVANELVLPATPLSTWRTQAALEAVKVENIRDAVFLSDRGNPIGIRVTFDATFPRTTVASLHPTALAPFNADQPYLMEFGRYKEEITPVPESADIYYVFRKGTTYKFTHIYVPHFVSYDARTRALCLPTASTGGLTQADLMAALSRSRSVSYRSAIQLSHDSVGQFIVAKEYSTSHSYDLEAMYRTVITEVTRRCDR